MSLEKAKEFMEELETNDRAMEKLDTFTPEKPDYASELAAVARETGYDVTDEDMTQMLMKMIQKQKESSDAAAEGIRVLDEDALDKVAGGGDHSTCADTYKDDENCWFDDNCRKLVNMYCKHHNKNCSSYTYCSSVLVKHG